MDFVEAKRENIFVKILTIASSGGGKSFTNLRLATGFAKELSKETGKEEKIAFINSEGKRGRLYADEFKYNILDLKAPFSPESYIQAIDLAIKKGFKVLIIDSISHEWSGKGGCLELHSKIPGNSYVAWGTITPRHEAFMDKILDSDIHIFCTVRGDDKYELQEINGKKVPVKIPLGYDQRKKLEYLFMASLMLDLETHCAIAQKDNTHLFEGKSEVITENHGVEICKWALGVDSIEAKRLATERMNIRDELKANEENEAKEISKKNKEEIKDIENNVLSEIEGKSLDEVKAELLEICKEKAKINRNAVIEILKDYNGNPSNIDNLEIAHNIYKSLVGI